MCCCRVSYCTKSITILQRFRNMIGPLSFLFFMYNLKLLVTAYNVRDPVGNFLIILLNVDNPTDYLPLYLVKK